MLREWKDLSTRAFKQPVQYKPDPADPAPVDNNAPNRNKHSQIITHHSDDHRCLTEVRTSVRRDTRKKNYD